MYAVMVSELGVDADGDGLPDLAERPSGRGKVNDVQHMAEAVPVAHGNGNGPTGDTRPTQRRQ